VVLSLLLLLLLLLLLELMLGPRIWRVELLRRRAMPQDLLLLLLLQRRRGCSTGRSRGLGEWRRGVGTLLAGCMMWVSLVGEDMTGLMSSGTVW